MFEEWNSKLKDLKGCGYLSYNNYCEQASNNRVHEQHPYARSSLKCYVHQCTHTCIIIIICITRHLIPCDAVACSVIPVIQKTNNSRRSEPLSAKLIWHSVVHATWGSKVIIVSTISFVLPNINKHWSVLSSWLGLLRHRLIFCCC